MLVARLARSGGEKGVTQHVACARVVKVLDGVSKVTIGEAAEDGFAHFRGRPEMIVAAGDEQERTTNLLDGDGRARDGFTVAQARSEEIAKHYRPARYRDRKS